jgi:hypothetical protein
VASLQHTCSYREIEGYDEVDRQEHCADNKKFLNEDADDKADQTEQEQREKRSQEERDKQENSEFPFADLRFIFFFHTLVLLFFREFCEKLDSKRYADKACHDICDSLCGLDSRKFKDKAEDQKNRDKTKSVSK